jgi:hypothetical protein
MLPVRLSGEKRIAIEENVYIAAGSWLQALQDGENRSPSLRIGSRTSMAGYCVLSAVRSVVLEDDVLLARNYPQVHKPWNPDQEPGSGQGRTGFDLQRDVARPERGDLSRWAYRQERRGRGKLSRQFRRP